MKVWQMGAVWLLLAGTAVAGTSTSPSQRKPSVLPVSTKTSATVASSRQIDFQSKVNGRRYRIQVALPIGAPPDRGFPVVYVLDGDGYFGTWAAAARMRAMAGELEPAVVVGVGYPESEQDMMATMVRRMDELAPTIDPAVSKVLGPAAPVPHAGAADLLQILHTEVPSLLSSVVKVDESRRILFGHSLGGLFTVYALFAHPDYFSTYLALSPSIWLSDRAVLGGKPGFLEQAKAGRVAARVYLVVGGKEQPSADEPLHGELPKGMTEAEVREMVARAAMVDNTMELLRDLQVPGGAPGYEVKGRVVPGESHSSVAWAAVNEMLDFALPPTH